LSQSAEVQQPDFGMHFLPHFFLPPLHFFFFLPFFLALLSTKSSREPAIPPSARLRSERRDGVVSERTNWSKRAASIGDSSANAELAAGDHCDEDQHDGGMTVWPSVFLRRSVLNCALHEIHKQPPLAHTLHVALRRHKGRARRLQREHERGAENGRGQE
jgi:hypothetical protein